MKKILLLLLAGNVLSAQNAELFNNNWYISKIIDNGQTTTTPAMDIPLSKSDFITVSGGLGSGYAFNSKHFNNCQLEISFASGTNSFSKTNAACTLSMYGGNNQTAVNNYDQKHQNFYIIPVAETFTYEIVNNGSDKVLIITKNSNGDKIYYNNTNSFLATKENLLKEAFLIAQNPVKENLMIEHAEKGMPFQIFDATGKLIYTGETSGEKFKIDTQHFAKGQYILIIKGSKPLKFIKE